ncbi:unnamed protein product [Caenorhabditis nigoni]
MDPQSSDSDDKRLLLLAKNLERPEKSKKPKTRKAVSCCFNTTKYSYKTCRCLIVYRCTWLILILLIFLAVFMLKHQKKVRKAFKIANAFLEEDDKS